MAKSPAESKAQAKITKSLTDIKDKTSLNRLEAALKVGDTNAALKALDVESITRDLPAGLNDDLLSVANDAILFQASKLSIKHSLNLTNQETIEYLERMTFDHALRIQKETVEAIRQAVVRSFREGIPVKDLARQIRDRVGLTNNQWQTVEKFEKYLSDLAGRFDSTADLSKTAEYKLRRGGMNFRPGADRGFGILNKTGLTDSRIDSLVEKYTKKLIAERAETIARTITMEAQNEGQNILWREAEKSGLLGKGRMAAKWILSPDDRLCPKCEAMQGMTRAINGTYEGGAGRPPLHMRCRCTEGLVRRPKE